MRAEIRARYTGFDCENDNIDNDVDTPPSTFKCIDNPCTWSILNAYTFFHTSVSSLDECAKCGALIHHMYQVAWEASNNIEYGMMKHCPWCHNKAKSKSIRE